jgi:hypothetical protein
LGTWDEGVGDWAGDGVYRMSITSSFFKNRSLFFR